MKQPILNPRHQRKLEAKQSISILDRDIALTKKDVRSIRNTTKFSFFAILVLGIWLIGKTINDYFDVKSEQIEIHIQKIIDKNDQIIRTMGNVFFIKEADHIFYRQHLDLKSNWTIFSIKRPPIKNDDWSFIGNYSTTDTSLESLSNRIMNVTQQWTISTLLEHKLRILSSKDMGEDYQLQEKYQQSWFIDRMNNVALNNFQEWLKKYKRFIFQWQEVFILLDDLNGKIKWAIKLSRDNILISDKWDKCSDCHDSQMYNPDKHNQDKDYVYITLETDLRQVLEKSRNDIALIILWELFFFGLLWYAFHRINKHIDKTTQSLTRTHLKLVEKNRESEKEKRMTEILAILVKLIILPNRTLQEKLQIAIEEITDLAWLLKKWNIYLMNWDLMNNTASQWMPNKIAWPGWECYSMLADPEWCLCQRVAALRRIEITQSMFQTNNEWKLVHKSVNTRDHWEIWIPIIHNNILLWVLHLSTEAFSNKLSERDKQFLLDITSSLSTIIEEHKKTQIRLLQELLIKQNPSWMMIFKLEQWELTLNEVFNDLSKYLISEYWEDFFKKLIHDHTDNIQRFILTNQESGFDYKIWDDTYRIDLKWKMWVLSIFLKNITARILVQNQLLNSANDVQEIIDWLPSALRTIKNWPLPTKQAEINIIDNFDLHQEIWEMSYIDIVNKAFVKMFWRSKDELQGMTLFDNRIIDRENAELLAARIIEFKANQVGNFLCDIKLRKVDWSMFDARLKSTLFLWNELWQRQAITEIEDVTDELAKSRELLYNASHDLMTGLLNKTVFIEYLDIAIAEFQRDFTMPKRANDDKKTEKKQIHIMLLDLDRFKIVNDTYWHLIWDELLVEAVNRIKSCVNRETDTIARLWWDEFGLLLPNSIIAYIVNLAYSIITALSEPFILKWTDDQISIWGSIWISSFPNDWINSKEILAAADRALYVSKNWGRNMHSVFNKDTTPTMKDLKEENDKKKKKEGGEQTSDK